MLMCSHVGDTIHGPGNIVVAAQHECTPFQETPLSCHHVADEDAAGKTLTPPISKKVLPMFCDSAARFSTYVLRLCIPSLSASFESLHAVPFSSYLPL